MKHRWLLLLLILPIGAGPAFAIEAPISSADGQVRTTLGERVADPGPTEALTIHQALAAALASQPQLRQARAELAAAQASADQERTASLPQLSLSTSYQFGPSRQNVNQLDVPVTNIGNYSLSVSADQMLYDFGQAGTRHRSALALVTVQDQTVRQTTQSVALGVRTAFYAAQANQVLVSVAKETLANRLLHQQRTKGLVEIGMRPPIDLAQTSKDVANARLQLINAEHAAQTAKAQLNQAMGVERATDYTIDETPMPPVTGEEGDLETMLHEALDRRPDVAAMAARLQAQELLVEAAGRAFWPSLKASAGGGVDGTPVTAVNGNWKAGAGLSWPILTGGERDARLALEQAKLASLQAQADALRQQLRLTIVQARLAVAATKTAVQAAAESTHMAGIQLELAEARYAAALGAVIELGEAQLAYTGARAQAVQEAYKLAAARAQLLQALGRE